MTVGSGERITIFISYSPADERWAAWIAWQLERAGHRAVLQAWDFIPGTDLRAFIDRGIREADLVVAVLSRNYRRSQHAGLDWQAVLRTHNPSDRLVAVRLEDIPAERLLATAARVDLIGVTDPDEARRLLLTTIHQALAACAKHAGRPAYPVAGEPPPVSQLMIEDARGWQRRRMPAAPPSFPTATRRAGTDRITLLHIAGPRFGRGLPDADEPMDPDELHTSIQADLTRLADRGAPRPDLLVVTGDLTESGGRRESEKALIFLTELRVQLGLEPGRVIIVPGPRDVSKKACEGYFSDCEADDLEPQPPYWPKWRHFTRLFNDLYQGLDGPTFDQALPWTLFELPELRTVVAGLNSTMEISHRRDDNYGSLGKRQAAWFAERLGHYTNRLRIGVVAHPPDTLHDSASTLDLLKNRLDLLVHGGDARDGEPEEIWTFDDGLLCVPALAPGRLQLIEITREGLRRWTREHAVSGPPPLQPYPLLRRLDTPRAQAEPPEGAPGEGHEEAKSQAARLLDRIEEVCDVRFTGAKIRRVDGNPPHVFVTHAAGDGIVRQFLIGAHAGTVTRELVDVFLSLVHTAGLQERSDLVYQGQPPPQDLRDYALRRGLRLQSFIEFQGLLDLSAYVADQTARLLTDRRYPPGLYVPQRFRELDRADGAVRDDLTGEIMRLLAADHGRFILLLGDFGTGKTFAMRELARRIPSELPHLTPLLIELRNLDKSQAVDSLVASHLTNHGEELIDVKAFHYMLRQGRIVLLLDGFDELVTRVTYERAADHLDTLLQAAEDKAKIVVAARTQHFQSRGQVMTALGERVERLPTHRVLSIEGFTTEQIRAFLVNRYGSQQAADDRMTLLGGISNLLDLASNPRMLSFIADLPEERVRAVAQAGGTISAASLYQEILDHWLRHEESRTRLAGAPGGLTLDELWRAVTTLAVRLWKTGETYLERSELDDVAATPPHRAHRR